jgi:hypothetical protein
VVSYNINIVYKRQKSRKVTKKVKKFIYTIMWGINGLQISERFVVSTVNWGSFFTASTTEVAIRSLLVPANTFGPGDILTVDYLMEKNGSAVQSLWKLYVNTSNTLTGATQLSIRSGGATFLSKPQDRKIAIRNGTSQNCVMLNVNQGVDTDYQSAISQVSKVTIDWSVDQYFIIALYNTVATITDPHRVFYIKISN